MADDVVSGALPDGNRGSRERSQSSLSPPLRASIPSRRLSLEHATPDAAREAIRTLLTVEPSATRKVYAALAHKVWLILTSQGLNEQIRDWHNLLLQTRSVLLQNDKEAAARTIALADLLRESISLAATFPDRSLSHVGNA